MPIEQPMYPGDALPAEVVDAELERYVQQLSLEGLQNFPIARALYDFQGNSKYELTFRAGEMLTVFSTVDEDGSGWWQGQMQNGEIGYFPGNYVEIIREGRELSDFHEEPVFIPNEEEVHDTPSPQASTMDMSSEYAPSASDMKCILCFCETWEPFPDRPHLCINCRHLRKMHRES